jgi:hypothetical protein
MLSLNFLLAKICPITFCRRLRIRQTFQDNIRIEMQEVKMQDFKLPFVLRNVQGATDYAGFL